MAYAGMPPGYNTGEALQRAADAYFASLEGEALLDADGQPLCDRYGRPMREGASPPTVSGLALALGFSGRQALLACRPENKALAEVLERAKARCEAYAEGHLFESGGAAGAKFSLVNNFTGWADKGGASAPSAGEKAFDVEIKVVE